MVNEFIGRDLIDAFQAAMRLRHLDKGQKLWARLKKLAQQQPVFRPWCRYMQGSLAFERHRWAEAEHILTELLQLELELELRGHALYSLGRSFDAQGRWQEAIAAFEQSLSIFTTLAQVMEQARAGRHIAISLHKGFTRGDFDSSVLPIAIAHCQSALKVLETQAEPSRDVAWLEGTVWNTLGLVFVSQGEWDQVIACYQKDLAICHELEDHFGKGITYGNLGEVYQKLGNWPEALAAYQHALDLIREFGGRYEEIDVLANLACLYQEKGELEPALDYYDQAIRVIEDLRAGAESELAQAGFFASFVDIYAHAVLLCLASHRFEHAFHLVERARSRALLDLLSAHSTKLPQEPQVMPVTLAEVQALLPSDAILLEYFTTGLLEVTDGRSAAPATQRHRFPPAQTLLFAVTRDTLHIHDTGLSPNKLRPSQLNNVVERHFLQPQIRRMLYDQLVAPVEELLRDKRRVYLVPHGPLHYIPFQALLAPNGESLLRENGPQLVYAPSASLLFHYGRTEAHQSLAPCLALGYNGRGEAQLHFAEEEAHSIARLTGGQALVGPASKKAALYQQALAYRRLHFSCHGEFDPDTPLASALHLGPDETITALDVLDHLRLQCDLVTLSACESGLSRVRRGDELVGLTRAFMYAGAPALISTLWRVDERSTRILMEKFYQQVHNGLDFAEALKQAQLYLKRLTRREVLDILANSIAPTTERLDPATSPDKIAAASPRTGIAVQQARVYLKGLTGPSSPGESQALSDETDDDRIFADPFYWAPFILIV